MGKEVRRTCTRCGTEWYVDAKEARAIPPNKLLISGASNIATGSKLTLFGGRRASAWETRALRLELKRERILALGRCGNCGSTQFR